ncbi:conserved Plasmodium protein, unknown function [Plasmodium malariae]|uniref:BRCT domain-containing protein n=1 Tax=Plasmodium malariae TaxID=5858 RepID=A0A1A8VQS0_PLAMA|nr:conserved Plasmodium protein, unknown function [Plasmodium malariae]
MSNSSPPDVLARYYAEEENKGYLRMHYFKKIDMEKMEKDLQKLNKVFQNDDIFLDIYINEKEKNNFDFFLNNMIGGMSDINYLEKWSNIELSNIYNYILYDNKYCSDVVSNKKGYLILKLKYTNENKIITSYFKMNCRNVKWENEKKVWHIPLFYIFEMCKLTIYLGGMVSDTVLYYLCKLFNHFSSIKHVTNVKMNELSTKDIKDDRKSDKQQQTMKGNLTLLNDNAAKVEKQDEGGSKTKLGKEDELEEKKKKKKKFRNRGNTNNDRGNTNNDRGNDNNDRGNDNNDRGNDNNDRDNTNNDRDNTNNDRDNTNNDRGNDNNDRGNDNNDRGNDNNDRGNDNNDRGNDNNDRGNDNNDRGNDNNDRGNTNKDDGHGGAYTSSNNVERAYNLEVFVKENKGAFIEYIDKVKMVQMEHIIINNSVKDNSMHIKIVPYVEDVVKKIKEINLFQWNKTENIWIVKKTNFKNFYINVIKHFDFKICSYYDYYKMVRQKLLEENVKLSRYNVNMSNSINSSGMTNIEHTNKKKIMKRKKDMMNEIRQSEKYCKHRMCYENTDSSYSDELSHNVDSSYYEGREQVNKIKLIGAANNYYKDIIYNKLNKVKNLRPPNYTYDPKGLITKNGAGTKGIEIFDMPSDINEWNKISFCIVPNEKQYIDLYDPKILCSLVSDVYLLKETAIDIILKRYNKWPEYSDVFWNSICAEYEFVVCNKNFNTRQKLAHDRLFNKQFFYIFNMESVKQSNYYDALFLCKTLITLGEGKLVSNPLEAEYIIISNCNDHSAINFYNSLQEGEEEKVKEKEKKKKKKKLPLFVTPNFIYDCILNYSISYPSKSKNHFSFV